MNFDFRCYLHDATWFYHYVFFSIVLELIIMYNVDSIGLKKILTIQIPVLTLFGIIMIWSPTAKATDVSWMPEFSANDLMLIGVAIMTWFCWFLHRKCFTEPLDAGRFFNLIKMAFQFVWAVKLQIFIMFAVFTVFFSIVKSISRQ